MNFRLLLARSDIIFSLFSASFVNLIITLSDLKRFESFFFYDWTLQLRIYFLTKKIEIETSCWDPKTILVIWKVLNFNFWKMKNSKFWNLFKLYLICQFARFMVRLSQNFKEVRKLKFLNFDRFAFSQLPFLQSSDHVTEHHKTSRTILTLYWSFFKIRITWIILCAACSRLEYFEIYPRDLVKEFLFL